MPSAMLQSTPRRRFVARMPVPSKTTTSAPAGPPASGSPTAFSRGARSATAWWARPAEPGSPKRRASVPTRANDICVASSASSTLSRSVRRFPDRSSMSSSGRTHVRRPGSRRWPGEPARRRRRCRSGAAGSACPCVRSRSSRRTPDSRRGRASPAPATTSDHTLGRLSGPAGPPGSRQGGGRDVVTHRHRPRLKLRPGQDTELRKVGSQGEGSERHGSGSSRRGVSPPLQAKISKVQRCDTLPTTQRDPRNDSGWSARAASGTSRCSLRSRR